MIPKTKIIATLGPSSSSETILRKMYINGLDVVRLNFSHGTTSDHIKKIELIRVLNRKMKRSIKIMQDLEGYRIRIGKLKNFVDLRKGKEFYLIQDNILGTEEEIYFDYEGSLKGFKKDTLIYINDGKVVVKVKTVEKKRLRVRTVTPGLLMDNKGVNIPGVNLDFSALTLKDQKDVEVAIKYKLDYIALSFVRNKGDLISLKEIVKTKHSECKIYSKIESKEALGNIDSIIGESDGIIVARGDLGICVPIYKVPVIQKEIIKKCCLAGKPVVVATQMLESMTTDSLPSRAEVSDVANAILDGATHLLLSGETAIGNHPHKVIDMMNKIVKNTETYIKNTRSFYF